MKFGLSILVATALVGAGLSFSTADEKSGWVSLFDGKTLDGWKKSTLGLATYSVEDGAIKGVTAPNSPNTFLLSEKQYGDFELEFEVKVHDALNSGVQIRSREKTTEDVGDDKKKNNQIGRFFGPQVEIEKSPGQSGFIYGEATGRGWLSPEPQSKDKEVNQHSHIKNGEWNKYRIVAKGSRIQVWINGNHVADLSDEEIYKSHPKGHIGLQVHGIGKATDVRDVYWKNIRIKEL